jgi:hypothetical protein
MTDNKGANIIQLRSDNYAQWSIKMEGALDRAEVGDAALGDSSLANYRANAVHPPNPARQVALRMRKAHGIIVGGLGNYTSLVTKQRKQLAPQHLRYDPYLLWTFIAAQQNCDNADRIRALRRQLTDIDDDFDDVEDACTYIEGVRDKIEAAGTPAPDEADLKAALCQALERKFPVEAPALRVSDKTYMDIQNTLKATQIRKKHQRKRRSSPKAFTAQGSSRRPQETSTCRHCKKLHWGRCDRTKTCTKCGVYGHIARWCKYSNSSKSPSSSQRDRVSSQRNYGDPGNYGNHRARNDYGNRRPDRRHPYEDDERRKRRKEARDMKCQLCEGPHGAKQCELYKQTARTNFTTIVDNAEEEAEVVETYTCNVTPTPTPTSPSPAATVAPSSPPPPEPECSRVDTHSSCSKTGCMSAGCRGINSSSPSSSSSKSSPSSSSSPTTKRLRPTARLKKPRRRIQHKPFPKRLTIPVTKKRWAAKKPVVVKKRRVYANENEAWLHEDIGDMLSGKRDFELKTKDSYVLDCATTHHISNKLSSLYDVLDYTVMLKGVNGRQRCHKKGKLALRLQNNKVLILKDVLFAPSSPNLIAESRLAKEYVKTRKHNKVTIRDIEGRILVEAESEGSGGLFAVNHKGVVIPEAKAHFGKTSLHKAKRDTLDKWHRRLGHTNHESIVQAHNEKRVIGMRLPAKCTKSFCPCCQEGKQKWKKVRWMTERDDLPPGEYLHCDTIVMPKRSRSKHKYVQVFVDDKSTFGWIVLTPTNDNLHEVVKTVVERVKAETQRDVKKIRCDNAFYTKKIKKLASTKGFTLEPKPPHEMGYVSKVDRYIQTLENTSRCLIIMAGLPDYFWDESMTTSCYILNRCTTKSTRASDTYPVTYRKGSQSRPHENIRLRSMGQNSPHKQSPTARSQMHPTWIQPRTKHLQTPKHQDQETNQQSKCHLQRGKHPSMEVA